MRLYFFIFKTRKERNEFMEIAKRMKKAEREDVYKEYN